MNARWTDQALEAARRQGDERADTLARKLLDKDSSFAKDGRVGYNYFQWVIDTMANNPGLALAEGSTVEDEWDRSPPELVAYFKPDEVPDWVDSGKLKLASQLWEENALAVIGALYSASLPACYLLKKGIVALYQTAKLTDPRYVYQRVYETGLFVEAVMARDGLKVMKDIGKTREAYTKAGVAAAPKRYLWGRGFMYARQVRLLHASMRFMLTQPGRLPSLRPAGVTVAESLDASDWRKQFADELPINQEDLAFTLLTFGLLIPSGLEKWGCRWTDAQKHAFLHLWKTVGHVMGIDAALLTDDWAEAEKLFATIRKRQAAHSEMGCRLGETVMNVLKDYLPHGFGIAENVPALLIRQQLGPKYADMIFYERRRKAARKYPLRGALRLGMGFLHLYYVVRGAIFRRSPALARLMGATFARAAEELVNSWRDEYQRRPFDVPPDAYVVPWLDDASLKTLHVWRRKLFYAVLGGVVFLIIAVLGLAAGAALFFLGGKTSFQAALWLTGGAFAGAIYMLGVRVSSVTKARPKFG
jgi:ER-bound oxygenase mpaB/B'/Rubber oxygenase, catalytic domain